MKNLKLTLTATVLSTSVATFAQSVNTTPFTAGGRQVLNINNKPASVAGTMYTSESFLPGKISTDPSTLLLRYNAYSDYFEINYPQEGTTKALPKKEGVNVTFVSTGEEYQYVTYHKNRDEITGYLNVISAEPKVKIYKRERVYLQEGSKSENGYSLNKPSEYKRASDEFYIQINGGDIVYFSSKGSLAKLIPQKSKEVKDFISKNDIDLEKPEDLKKLGAFLSTQL